MTIKQKLAVDKIVENHGNISKSMIQAGYDLTTAKNPSNLTKSKGWAILMKTRLSDDKLLKAHEEALQANKQIGAQILINAKGEVISKENEGMIEVPDHAVRLKAAELGYKLKGRLHSDTAVVPVQINNNIDSLSDSIKEIVKAIYDQHPTTRTNTV